MGVMGDMGEDKIKILAIDDDAQQLREFKLILVPKYDLRVVKSASEALSFLNSNKIDIILLDIGMPNISGFEFMGDIRKIPSYMGVPIIIVSGSTGPDIHEQAKKSNASAVLAKPVKQDQLVNAIEKALI
jgi:CheY-like chemotaxis protein